MLACGEGVLQPKFDQATKSSGFDKDMAEEFATMLYMYQSDQWIFGDRLLNYEQQDEDGNGDSYPKKMDTAYKVFAHHQTCQDSTIPRRYGCQFLQDQQSLKRDANGYCGRNANACILCNVDIPDIVCGTNGEIWTMKCNECQKWGHANNHCLVSPRASLFKAMLLQHFHHHHRGEEITAVTNAGTIHFNKCRKLRMLPDTIMYHNNNSVATVLALQDLQSIPNSFVYYGTRHCNSFLLVFVSG
eukprot:4943519-Ditylum_brightwellii.AAC.1